jgi:hypothetical protein
MTRARIVTAACLAAAMASTLAGQQRPPAFRGGTDLVRVDVIVRDREGNIVRGLQAGDFTIQEDGKAQAITSFNFEEIATGAIASAAPVPAMLGLDRLQAAAAAGTVTIAPSPSAAVPPAASEAPAAAPSGSQDLAGRRMIVLLFDTRRPRRHRRNRVRTARGGGYRRRDRGHRSGRPAARRVGVRDLQQRSTPSRHAGALRGAVVN